MKLNTIRGNSNASRILDFCRFGSAIIVFLYHFYVPVPGYQAVMVFFVLSGYFISTSIFSSIINQRWDWSDYLLKRIARLWIVLIPSLLLTFIWAKIQFNLFGISHEISNCLNFKTFFGNLFFLQGISVPQYGLNGPLWSLSYEFWYYILFPCILLIFYSKKKSSKIFYIIICLTISTFVGKIIMEYFLIWLLGAAIPLIKPILIKSKPIKFLLTFISLILTFSSTKYPYLLIKSYYPSWKSPGIQVFADLSVGISFAIFVYIVVSLYKESSESKLLDINKQLAGFSYTLYLTHFPLMYIIITWRNSPFWHFNIIESLLIKPIIVLFVVSYAWFIASLTEKHTDKIRLFLKNRVIHKSARYVLNLSSKK